MANRQIYNQNYFRMNNQNEPQYLRGALAVENYGEYFLQQYERGVATLNNRPRQLQNYYRARNHLYLEAEEVITVITDKKPSDW